MNCRHGEAHFRRISADQRPSRSGRFGKEEPGERERQASEQVKGGKHLKGQSGARQVGAEISRVPVTGEG